MIFRSARLPLACVAMALPLALGACQTLRETQPKETATEQLLMSHAAEIAAAKLALGLPAGERVWIDASHFAGDRNAYALSAIRASLLRAGVVFAEDRKSAQVVVELRLGALSIDQSDTIFGIPAGFLPIPGTLTAFPVPELSLYSEWKRTGVAEFSAFAYDPHTGRAIAFAGPVAGERQLRQRKYFTVFTSGGRVERPGVVDADAASAARPR